ncbi:hypothetical protein ACTHPH_08700 [Paenibacillus pasadenensis]|uniref:hypothetical protein n=1 Tax=Paenibacillus pasadenensis TaxID=217090 RepID=UPI000406C008|nr:hypothetical protein [Paenibacillus pasadenensis]
MGRNEGKGNGGGSERIRLGVRELMEQLGLRGPEAERLLAELELGKYRREEAAADLEKSPDDADRNEEESPGEGGK